MTVDLYYIAPYVILLLLGSGITLWFTTAHNRRKKKKEEKRENSTQIVARIDRLQERMKDCEVELEKQQLITAEMKEFSTRAMNRAAARSSKADKTYEKAEMLNELLAQNQQIEGKDPEQGELDYDRPRLIRRNGK